jgi:hypothetical protein
MPEGVDEDVAEAERIAGHSDQLKEGWKLTLEDMESMAEERGEMGWETTTVGAVDTAPEHPESGSSDRWGLVYTLADNHADRFAEAFAAGDYTEWTVYQNVQAGHVFSVTEFRDPDAERSIFLAGQFAVHKTRPLLETARSEGKMYTHVRRIDDTMEATIEHDDYAEFFPTDDSE